MSQATTEKGSFWQFMASALGSLRRPQRRSVPRTLRETPSPRAGFADEWLEAVSGPVLLCLLVAISLGVGIAAAGDAFDALSELKRVDVYFILHAIAGNI